MNDPIIAQFAEACGATAPLDLRVELADGGRRVQGTVSMPFSLVGRDDGCDVTLTDEEVNPRHAWLQVVGGRVLAVDLGSRAGLQWPGQGTGSGWLDIGVPVGIGPFQLSLCSPVSSRPVSFPPAYSPLQSDPAILRAESVSVLEFRNGKRARDRWAVNRFVTLVGRAPECKIRLSADDIAAYHCGLVLTPTGLWVVDLSGRGVVVNGERMRVSPLGDGAELWIGRFLIGTHREPAGTPGAKPVPPEPPPAGSADDEVPLGVAPPADPLAGLPSSHIMAGAFQQWAGRAGGGVSSPVLVSSSGPPPQFIPVVPGARPQQQPFPDAPGPGLPPDAVPPTVPAAPDPRMIVAILHELGDLQGQMFTQFQQSLGLMVRLFNCLGSEQLPVIQQELARIHELNNELAQLQAEVARRAAEERVAQTPGSRPATGPSTPTPMPDSAALHDWVTDRVGTLQRERQTRWQSLVGLFSPPEGRGQ